MDDRFSMDEIWMQSQRLSAWSFCITYAEDDFVEEKLQLYCLDCVKSLRLKFASKAHILTNDTTLLIDDKLLVENLKTIRSQHQFP